MTRGEFLKAAGSAAVLAAAGEVFGAEAGEKSVYESMQAEIDKVTPEDYKAYLSEGPDSGIVGQAALKRLDAAYDKVLGEVKTAVVTDKPAVWLVYNMGVIVKTQEACFSIDLKHRRAKELAPLLDFALITHNHSDHFGEAFYKAMDGRGKTVISNFKDNYGAYFRDRESGGYTRAEKTFRLKDVEIKTSLTDHNGYLADFTTTFEIRIGEFVIYHSGDCSNVKKLNPTRRPDLWIVHPYCGMGPDEGVKKMQPKLTAIAHLNELGHARDRWRWSWNDGLKAAAKCEAAGGKAVVPVWGERIV